MSADLGSPAVCHSQSADNSFTPTLPGPLDLKRALEESSFNSWRLQWRVLTNVCHPPALSRCKTDPTWLPFQAGGMYYKQNRTDSIRIYNWIRNCDFDLGLIWVVSSEMRGGAVGFLGARRLILSHTDLQEIMTTAPQRSSLGHWGWLSRWPRCWSSLNLRHQLSSRMTKMILTTKLSTSTVSTRL